LAGNSITEFNEKTGSQVRIIHAKADAFHHQDGIAVQGSHIWVTNSNEQLGMGGGNYDTAKYSSATELNAKIGSLVRVIDATADGFLEPGPIAVSGSHVWVLNQNASSFSPSKPGIALVELNANTGSLVHVFTTNVDGLYGPLNLTASRSDVWISNVGGPVRSVIEINSQNDSLVRIIKVRDHGLYGPTEIIANDAKLWVLNVDSVTELNQRNGSLAQVVK
jgi:hypothetical protein